MAITQVPPALLTSTTGTGTTVALSASPTFTGTVTTPGVTFSDASVQTAAASPYVLKNRIINGAMVINQRAWTGTVVTDGTYTLDRFVAFSSVASKYSVSQNAGSVTPPIGFSSYLGATSLAVTTLGASDYYVIAQRIEGYNIADLGWGTANAKTITLSFWVYSSLTGTFGGSLQNGTQARSYPYTYTISTANTWTQISITIAGDTSGTWSTTNTEGIGVYFGLGVGTTFSGTANAWGSAQKFSATGATSVVGTNGATFYVTGVQLEIGSSATPFERRLYNQELANCQRYALILGLQQTNSVAGLGFAYTTTGFAAVVNYPVAMRTIPTFTQNGAWAANNALGAVTLTGGSINTTYSSTLAADLSFSAASGLVAATPYRLTAGTSAAGSLVFSAEL